MCSITFLYLLGGCFLLVGFDCVAPTWNKDTNNKNKHLILGN